MPTNGDKDSGRVNFIFFNSTKEYLLTLPSTGPQQLSQQSLATAISMYGSEGWPSPASSTPQYKSCSTLPLSQRA